MGSMIAATVGVGAEWHELAAIAAASVSRHTGLQVHILDEQDLRRSRLPGPYWLKFRLFDLLEVDTVLFFDADVLFVRPWNPTPYAGLPEIVCVRDRWWKPEIIADASQFGVPPHEYFNSGMFIANRRHHSQWLRCAERCMSEHSSLFWEQGALNAARRRLNLGLRFLDRRYNSVGAAYSPLWDRIAAFAIHHAGEKDRAVTLRSFKALAGTSARTQSRVDERAMAQLAGCTYSLRVGSGPLRQLEFRPDGTIGRGNRVSERFWFVLNNGDYQSLVMANEAGVTLELLKGSGGWLSKSTDGDAAISVEPVGDPLKHAQYEDEVAREFIQQRFFRYRRVGFDTRDMEFLPHGRIGRGRAACEEAWYVEALGDDSIWLCIFGRDEETCRLRLEGDGVWRGRWNIHERMAVELEPLGVKSPSLPVAQPRQL
jgi:hypothetical protein